MGSAKQTLTSIIQAKMQELPPEQSFLVDYMQTVAKLHLPEKGSNYYKPSSMNCDRCMYYIAKGIDLDNTLPSYNSIRITDCGTSSHAQIQYYVSQMRNKGFDCDWIDPEWYVKAMGLDYLQVREKKGFEVKFLDTRYNLSFMCDGIIRYKGKYYILEIKTETDYKNNSRTEADASHRNQSICYSLSLGINDIMWLYESRNICDIKCYHTNVDDREKESVILKIEYVDDCVKRTKIPPKCSNLKFCNYCDYKNTCRRDG